MNIKATLLASVLSMPLVAGAALAADVGNQSLVTAVKQGRQADVQSILSSGAKQDVATQGGAALIWAASHNDNGMVDLLLGAGANPKAVNEFGATALYAAAEFADPAVNLLAAGPIPMWR
jgi:ankyrin repeat protein